MQVCLKCFQTGLIDRGVGGAALLLRSHAGCEIELCVYAYLLHILCVCAGVSQWERISWKKEALATLKSPLSFNLSTLPKMNVKKAGLFGV